MRFLSLTMMCSCTHLQIVLPVVLGMSSYAHADTVTLGSERYSGRIVAIDNENVHLDAGCRGSVERIPVQDDLAIFVSGECEPFFRGGVGGDEGFDELCFLKERVDGGDAVAPEHVFFVGGENSDGSMFGPFAFDSILFDTSESESEFEFGLAGQHIERVLRNVSITFETYESAINSC